jgi:hypothetical protein
VMTGARTRSYIWSRVSFISSRAMTRNLLI